MNRTVLTRDGQPEILMTERNIKFQCPGRSEGLREKFKIREY